MISEHKLRLYVEAGLYLTQIAKVEEVGTTSVTHWLIKYGLKVRGDGRHDPAPQKREIPKDRLETYIAEGLTKRQMTEREGCSYTMIGKWLSLHRLTIRGRGVSKEQLMRYVEQDLTTREMSALTNTTMDAICKRLRHFGLNHDIPSYRTLERKQDLERHIHEGRSIAGIASFEGISTTTVVRHLRYHKLKTVSYESRREVADRIRRLDPDELANLVERGVSYTFIANRLGVTRYVVDKECNRLGLISIPAQRRKYVILANNRENLSNMVAQGLTQIEIARRIDVDARQVSQWLNKYDLHAPRGTTPSSMSPTLSYPCEELKRMLHDASLSFTSELPPLESRKFRIDIAFPDIKLGLEVNGSFHYENLKTQKLAPYYQDRHDLIVAAGWELIEIPYLMVWESDYVEDLIKTIRECLTKKAA